MFVENPESLEDVHTSNSKKHVNIHKNKVLSINVHVFCKNTSYVNI